MSIETPAADTEARILDAAHRVFLRRGVAAARTQEIAEEAGVNKALLHYYFRSKEKLSDAVFLRAASELLPRFLMTLASDLPLRQRLTAAIAVQMETMEANPYLPGYILCEMRSAPDRLRALMNEAVPVEQMRAQVLASLAAGIEAEVEAGRMRPTQPQRLLVALMSLLIFPHAGAHMLEIAIGLDAPAQKGLADWRREHLADFLLRGFAP